MAQETLFPRDPGQIRLIVVDLMFTLLIARKHARKRMICKLYREIGRIADDVTDRSIWREIQSQRNRFAGLADDEDYWRLVNQAVLESVLVNGQRQYANTRGRDIHTKVLTDPSLYKACRWLPRILKLAKRRGMRIVIGSNQRHAPAHDLLRHFDLLDLIDAVYTSESLGVRKPHPAFWTQLLHEEGIPAREARHIGNSVRSDLGSVEAGVRAILIDSDGSHEDQVLKPKDSDSPADYRKLAALRHSRLVRIVRGGDDLSPLLKRS